MTIKAVRLVWAGAVVRKQLDGAGIARKRVVARWWIELSRWGIKDGSSGDDNRVIQIGISFRKFVAFHPLLDRNGR